MALVKCRECGEKVAKTAKQCPACGAPAKQKTAMFTWLVVVIIAVVIYGRIQLGEEPAAPLTPEQKAARVLVLVEALKMIPASEVRANLEKYKELVELAPQTERYAAKVAHYEARLTRLKKIEGQFSQWSGAHQPLEKYVKNNLKDPDSYEHIESRYTDKGSSVVVSLRYRARNSFGGFAVELVRARCTIDGDCTVL